MIGPVSLVALTGIGEVRAGDDLAELILAACRRSGVSLLPGDVLCVSSKIVSKALGLTADDRDGAVVADTRSVVAIRRTPRGLTSVVRSMAGPVMAAAGVDESNTGPDGRVLRLPTDPDGEARRLRRAIALAAGLDPAGPDPAGPDPAGPDPAGRDAVAPAPAVVITDTAGRPWRDGQTDFALGVAGLHPVDDVRGSRDADGRVMEVTVRAVADEIAAAADLVKGKVGATPVAVLRGLAAIVTTDDGPGAAAVVRDPAQDWFGLGDIEAVHAALGVSPADAATLRDDVGAPPGRVPGDPLETLHRAVAVAGHGRGAALDAVVGDLTSAGDGRWWLDVEGDPVAVGRMLERVVTAAAAERLLMSLEPVASPGADREAPTQQAASGRLRRRLTWHGGIATAQG